VVSGAKWFLQVGRAVPADFEQPVGEHGSLLVFILHPFKAFADCLGHGFGHAFSGEPGQPLGELVGVFVFDVQAHMVDILPS